MTQFDGPLCDLCDDRPATHRLPRDGAYAPHVCEWCYYGRESYEAPPSLVENEIAGEVLRFARSLRELRDVPGLSAHRMAGTPGLTGFWQCYVPARGGGLTSCGPNIHATSGGACYVRVPR